MALKDDDLLPEERALMTGNPVEEEPAAEPTELAAEAASTEAPAEAASAPEAGAEPAAETAAEPAAPEAAAALTQEDAQAFRVDDTAAIADQRKALRAEKQAIETKWSSGELSDEDRAEQLATIDDRLDTLLIEQTRAETLREANAQNALREQTNSLKRVNDAAKKQGIDYADEGMAAMYDAKLRAVVADEAFKGKSFDEVAQEAHKRVLKAIGRDPEAKSEPAATPAPAPRANPRANVPPTLGNMPAAAAQPVGNDLAEQLDAITDPDELERRWAALPASQRTGMLRSTMRL